MSLTVEQKPVQIAVLIPAHNEAAGIKEAVTSVLTQSVCSLPYVVVEVVVIADNCTDNTALIVQEMQEHYPNLHLTTTVNNKGRKAGALNHGFTWVTAREDYTYIFTLDADTVLDPYIIEHGIKGIQQRDGGICCRVGLLPFEKNRFSIKPFSGEVATWAGVGWVLKYIAKKMWWLCEKIWEELWWAFQNIEYSIAQSETVERHGWAHCLCGPGTLYRASVLQELYEKNNGEIWRRNSLVEDYYLTKEIQEAGYTTRVGHDMFSYTDAPLGFRAHWRQRTRWYGGNISTWFSLGLNRYSIFEGLDMGFQLLWFACRVTLIMIFMHILVTGFVHIDSASVWLLCLPVLTSALNLLRFRYVPYKSVLQLFLVLFLLYEVYALWYGIVLIGSLFMAYTSRSRW